MKGYRFYEELENKNRKGERSKGIVVAIYHENESFALFGAYSAAAALYDEPNAPVCGTIVGGQYLADCCRRVSEARAREIHPQLFEYLDS